MNVTRPGERLEGVTGVILAGGAGKRLGGVEKALIEIGGEPIIARTLRLFDRLFPVTLISSNRPELYEEFGPRVVPDEIAGKGAPGGLHAALKAAETPWVFLAACDMPRLAADPIEELAGRREGADIVVFESSGRPEPLAAFYHQRCHAVLDRLFSSGNPSFRDLMAEVKTIVVDAGSNADVFRNVNTPEELDAVGGSLPEKS